MKYAYYPGCSLESTAKEFDKSIKFVAKKLGMELIEIPDWVCCGASSTHFINHTFAVALPAFTIIQAQEMGLTDILAPCMGCFSKLIMAKRELESDRELRERVERIIGKKYQGGIRIRSVIDVLYNDVGVDKIREKTVSSLRKIPIAAYYGCVMTRPRGNCDFDDVEYPTSMDEILKAIGAEPVDWPSKTDCCGATLSITMTDAFYDICNKILSSAKTAGASAIACSCPLCHANLDMRQPQIERKFNVRYNLPILYITQLVGLALGGSVKELGIKRLIVPIDVGLSLAGLS